jgi:hypothetical protein
LPPTAGSSSPRKPNVPAASSSVGTKCFNPRCNRI